MNRNTGRRKRRLYLCTWILLCQGMLLCGCRPRHQYQILAVSSETESQVQLTREPDGHASDTEESGTGGTASPTGETGSRMIRVYVCGAVVRSGVYELEKGSRVADALEAAGGFSQEADREWVNLARTVADGERVAFYTLEQTQEMKEQGILCEEGGSLSGDRKNASGSGLVNLNTATKEELMTLPGIGESRAMAILHYREQQGSFQNIEDIMQIQGIKESVFASIRDLITV